MATGQQHGGTQKLKHRFPLAQRIDFDSLVHHIGGSVVMQKGMDG